MRRGQEEAGELLACFEMFLLNRKGIKLPLLPPKIGNLYRLPKQIKPNMKKTLIEVKTMYLFEFKYSQQKIIQHINIMHRY